MKHRKLASLTVAAATLASTAVAFAAPAGASPAAAAAFKQHGCPPGAVCIYPKGTGWNGGHPEANGFFYSYGYHNLTGQVGLHRIFNNQTGGAIMRTCTGYNGKGCQGIMDANQYEDKQMTPINSIVLAKK